MTKEAEEKLRVFETRVRQLILQYKALTEKNAELQLALTEGEKEIAAAKEEIRQLQDDYNNLTESFKEQRQKWLHSVEEERKSSHC